MKVAEEEGDKDAICKAACKSVKVSQIMSDDAKKLVRLMGVPIIEAPCEAEAQCAELTKMGIAWATATEDMDALTFGS